MSSNKQEQAMQIKTTRNVFMPSYVTLDEAKENSGSYLLIVNSETCSSYTKVGTATVTIDLLDDGEIKAVQVDSLNKQITKVRSEAENAITQLQKQIQSLLALEAA